MLLGRRHERLSQAEPGTHLPAREAQSGWLAVHELTRKGTAPAKIVSHSLSHEGITTALTEEDEPRS